MTINSIGNRSKSNDQNIPYFVLVGGRRKLHEPMTDMKIKTGIKKNPVRGPLKAMPQTAMKPTRGDPPMTAAKSVFKRLQPSNTSSSSNTSMIEVCFGNKMVFFIKKSEYYM